jgi:hypothetical protein
MPKVVDLTGQNFGRLVVVRQAGKRVRPNGSTATKWLCICEWDEKPSWSASLSSLEKVQSCGCLRTELLRARATTHGMSKAPEYRSFVAAKERCKPNHRQAKDYYDLGRRFLFSSFEEFIAEVGTMEEARRKRELPPGTPLFLERIDNDGNYESGNVKWATRREQNLNRRTVRKLQVERDRLQEVLKRRNEALVDLIVAQACHQWPRSAAEAAEALSGV